jgi:predicted YcjX-like family ATPase
MGTFKRNIGIVGLAWSGKTVFLTSLIHHLQHHDPDKFALQSGNNKFPHPAVLKYKRLGLENLEHSVPAAEANLLEYAIRGLAQVKSLFGLKQESREGAEDAGVQVQIPPDEAPNGAESKNQRGRTAKRFINLSAFDKDAYWAAISDEHMWPAKTRATSAYRCQFEREDWSFTDVDLTFYDFPGERFSDAIMLGKSYVEWSDALLKYLEVDRSYRELAQEYLSLQNQIGLDSKMLIQSYKKILANLILHYRPLITPSTFILDEFGKAPSTSDVEKMASEHYSGLSQETQFAPMSAALRHRLPDVREMFAKHYDAYSLEIPQTSFDLLKRCHRLVVLIDVTNILASNVGRLNDSEAIIENVLRSCVQERSGWGRLRMFLSSAFLPNTWRPAGISRIAFVATKSDMVHPSQVDNLLSLLRDLVKKKVRDYGIRHDYFTCAAIRSTEIDGDKLLGHPVYTPEGRRRKAPQINDLMAELNPSDVPENWPDFWESGTYFFPEVWPRIPRRKSDPPEQQGLNRIFNYLLDEDWTE